jgi:hypothetical protein
MTSDGWWRRDAHLRQRLAVERDHLTIITLFSIAMALAIIPSTGLDAARPV